MYCSNKYNCICFILFNPVYAYLSIRSLLENPNKNNRRYTDQLGKGSSPHQIEPFSMKLSIAMQRTLSN